MSFAKLASSRPATRWHTVLSTPLGPLTVCRDEVGITGVHFPHHWHPPAPAALGTRVDRGFEAVAEQLAEYFAGRRRRFELGLHVAGDARQRRVWTLIDEIPYGRTSTYGELAGRLGGGATPREVGAATGRNPLSILIACHRVVGRDGRLTGYAGGLERKRMLLDLELRTARTDEDGPRTLW
ncbi:MAG: methylated-DNA--[protein]-cysteine S-methyltransferase [Actinobacteria bacterium]|nr:methylated-DNA--[protein]-cysteine S-methyltransferase [Actinomycetota bacterium]